MAGGLSPDATPRQVRELLAAQPVDGWTLRDLNIGIAVLQRHGAQEESLVLHAELVARRPDPAIRARYGRTLRQAGRRAEAERIFRDLIADGAADQAVYEDLRGLLLSAGDAEGALQIARAEQDRFGASENLLMFLTALPGTDGTALARQLIGKVPFGGGLIPKAAIAYAATKLVGVSLERYYRVGYTYTREERNQIYTQAFERGKGIVSQILKRMRPDLWEKHAAKMEQAGLGAHRN